MKKNTFAKVISVILSIVMVATVVPIYTYATDNDATADISTLENQLKIRVLTHTDNTKYTSTVKMGNKTVLPYYYKNLIYSSPTLSTSYTNPMSTINVQIRCPKVVVGVYDGNNLPTFPVTAFSHLTNEHKIAGFVLADEEGLYETSSPTNDKGCTNCWRGFNGDAAWHTPEDTESIFILGSKRADWHYKVYYTRGNYNGYDITLSNTLTPRIDYLYQALSESGKGYIKSDYNDTGFYFACASWSDGSIYELPYECPLGDSAVQYIIDTSEINNILATAKSEFQKIFRYNNKYDQSKLYDYYDTLLNMLNFSLSDDLSGINDDNAANMVDASANKINTLISEYKEARDNLGKIYVDPTTIKEYVDTNYSTAEITKPNKKIIFQGVTVNDVTKWDTVYNFGKNLAYCSQKTIQGPNIICNNVSSCTVVPATVVMIYDGISETSFPIKWAYGVSASNSGYSGANLHTIFLGDEYSDEWGKGSNMYNLGNYYWLNANHTSPAVDIDKWFTSASQINSRCENFNQNNGTEGINLSLQYGGFYNKVVLNNGKYSNSLEVEPLTNPINLNLRYYWMSNDQYPHRASNNTKQYVLNIVPLIEKTQELKIDYNNTIGTYSYDSYSKESVEKYYRAIYDIITFDITNEFSECTDTNAKIKTQECVDKISNLCTEYDEAYKELSRKFTITFTNYAGEVISTQECEEGEMPETPQNTAIKKVSSTSKFHFVYSWPTVNAATSNLNYKERRTSVLCTLDNGTITKPATCSSTGEKKYYCSVCDDYMYETLDKLNHDYSLYKAQYKDGTKYSNTLKHDLTCTVGGEALYSETCDFELIGDSGSTIIYGCVTCGGLAIYTKARYTITFTKNNEVISSKEYLEDQTVEIPDLPSSFNDEQGHHSFAWDTIPNAIPTANASYNITESITSHNMSEYKYNNDANVNDIYGTETSSCSICDYQITRACSEPHAPTAFNVTGKIVVANSTTGAPTSIPISNATITVIDGESTAITDKNGVFTLENLPAGEYEIIISSDSSIDRTATVSVNLMETGMAGIKNIDAIGLVNFDYNKDGKINTVDATLFNKQSNNNATSKAFKAVFNKTIKYSKISL